jgi:hypothetical protein
MKKQIYLAPYGSNTFFLMDLYENVPLPHSRSIIDITSIEGGPGELMSGASKTLVFPGTKNNNQVFGFLFEINLADGSFNTSKRAYARVAIDDINIIDGVIRLEKVSTIKGRVEYNCQLTEGLRNFYNAMQNGNSEDAMLTDIPFSDLNHTYDFAHISASWTATTGSGYVYPMIDYGNNDLHRWFVNQFFPAVYVKEYIDRIFKFCNFTYTSNFFGTAFFKRLIIPCNDAMIYTFAEVLDREFNANMNGITQIIAAGTNTLIAFAGTTSNPFTQFNTASYSWTPVFAGNYVLNLDLQITSAGGTTTIEIDRAGIGVLGTWSVIGSGHLVVSTGINHLDNTDTITVRVYAPGANSTAVQSVSIFYDTFINDGIAEGSTVSINGAIPQNIKMKDFFESIGKMFNLQVMPDPYQKNNLIIEPWADFYNGVAVDWTRKLDKSKEIVVTPMGLLNNKNYLFTYSSDADYWNKYYTDRHFTLDHDEIFGERQKTTDNDYLTSNKKTDVIFAPTPLTLYNTGIFAPAGVPNTKVLSTIHLGSSGGNDPVNDASARNKSVIRILYYGGLITGDWQWSSSIGAPAWTSETQYPYAGHLDDPNNPTIDLNYGVPGEIFYQPPNYTNNNLYNAYYQQFIDEITDKDSKVVELYARLTVLDMMQLSFRNLIFIDGTYYKLLEIVDFDFSTLAPVKLKLLKSTTKQQIAITQFGINGGGGSVGSERVPRTGNAQMSPYMQQGAVVALGGQGNVISKQAYNVICTGDNNNVFGNSFNVSINGGSGNSVLGNNVTLINCTGLNITENNVVYVNNVKYVPNASASGNNALVGGTKLVAYPGVTVASRIIVSWDGTGVLTGELSVTPAADSFTLNSTAGGDTAGVNWFIAKL